MAWLSDWAYRKSKSINGTADGAQTNYQIKFNVYKGSGTDSGDTVYLDGNCRDDFGDIRFTDSDGSTLLDYWIESSVSGTSAVIWVEIPTIAISPGTASLYIYYSNSDASDASNGTNTFYLYDHFTAASIDTGIWTESTSYAVLSGSICTFTPPVAPADNRITSVTGFAPGYAIRTRSQINTGSWAAFAGFHLVPYSSPYQRIFGYTDATNNWTTISDAATADIVTNWTKGSYTIKETRWDDVNSNLSWYEDDVQKTGSPYTTGANIPNETLQVLLCRGAGVIQYIDWIILRKFTVNEPTQGSWGSEELGPYRTHTTNSYIDTAHGSVTHTNDSKTGTAEIKLKGSLSGSGAPNYLGGVQSLKCVGDYLYVSSLVDSRFTILHIDDDTTLSYVGSLALSEQPRTAAISSDGNWAFLSTQNSGYLRVIDCSNKSAPSLTGSVALANSAGVAYDEAEEIVYVTAYDNDTIYAINVATKSNPTVIGSISGAGSPNYLNGVHDVWVLPEENTIITESHYDGAVCTFDITDPTNITLKDAYVAYDNLYRASQIWYDELTKYIYVTTLGADTTTNTGNFVIIDGSDLSNLQFKGILSPPAVSNVASFLSFPGEDWGFLASAELTEDIWIVSTHNKAQPRVMYSELNSTWNGATAIAYKGKNVYIGDYNNAVKIYAFVFNESRNHTTDALLDNAVLYNITHTTDALLNEIMTYNITHTTDAFLYKISNITHTTDTFLVNIVTYQPIVAGRDEILNIISYSGASINIISYPGASINIISHPG